MIKLEIIKDIMIKMVNLVLEVKELKCKLYVVIWGLNFILV